MPILYDIIVIGIIVLFGWHGARKGIIGAVISVAITIAAALVTVLVSRPLAEACYERYIKDQVIEQMQSGLESYDVVSTVKDGIKSNLGIEVSDNDVDRIAKSHDVFAEMQSIAADYGQFITDEEMDEKWKGLVSVESIKEISGNKIPDEVAESISDTLRESREKISAVVQAVFSDDKEWAARQIEYSIIRDQVVALLSSIFSVVIFAAAAVIMRMLYAMISALKIIPVIEKTSTFAGLLLGVIEGVLVVFVIGLFLNMVIDSSLGAISFLNHETIDKTFILKFFV